jgi:hypothetical protein
MEKASEHSLDDDDNDNPISTKKTFISTQIMNVTRIPLFAYD